MKFLKFTDRQMTVLKLCIGLGLAGINAWVSWWRNHSLLGVYILVGIVLLLGYVYFEVKKK